MADSQVEDITLEDALREFEAAQTGFDESEDYLNAEQRDIAIGIATPPALRTLLAQVGIPRIYVSALVDRLIVEGFRVGEDTELEQLLWHWFKVNQMDTASRLLHTDFIGLGRGYVTISAPTEEDANNPLIASDVPIIRVESPRSMYAKINPRTREVEWAVRSVEDEDGQRVAATLYLPDRTEFYEGEANSLELVNTVQHNLGVVPVVDAPRQKSSSDIYGSSMITPELRSVTDAMSRAMMNLQTTSELMATPQRVIFGASKEELQGDAQSALELYVSSYIAVEDPQGKAVSLPSAELRNYTEALAHMMKMAAAYTGLPPQYLSTQTDNPASAEAIRASESRLVRTCESLASVLGDAWEKVMRISLLVMGHELSDEAYRLEVVWRDPATPTLQAKADAVTKTYANGSGPIPKEQARIDLGYTPEQRRQMEEWDRESLTGQLVSMYEQDQYAEVEDESSATGA